MLEEKLADAREGRGGIVLVAGEPGIGKSTLIAEAAERARRDNMTAVWGRCREDGGAPPYLPWVHVLQVVVEAAGQDHEWGPGFSDVAGLIAPVSESTASPSDPAERFRLFASVVAVLRSAAGSRGLLIVIDDLHRADEGSLAFLRYLAPELAALSVLVVAAYRDSELQDDHPLAATIGVLADRVTLPVVRLVGLDDGEVAALMDHHGGPLHPDVVQTIAARTSGNPLFVIELAGLLRVEHGDPATLAATAIPTTVREVIAQRVGRLPPEARQALRAAAVLGRDFGRLPLSAVLGTSELAVAAALQPAARVRLICAGPAGGYQFTHALVQAAVYDAIDVGERTDLHQRAAHAIAELGADDDESVSDLAFHSYHAALAGDLQRALTHTLAAARRARDRLAFEEASRWMSLTLELAERRGPRESELLDLLLESGDAAVRAGLVESGRARFERAALIARRRQDARALTKAALGAGSAVVHSAGRVDWALVDLLVEAARAAVDDADQARLESRLAIELYWHEGGEPSRAQSLVALETAERSGEKEALGVALVARQFTLRGPEHLDERIAVGERLIALARACGNDDLLFRGTLWFSIEVLIKGDLPKYRSLVGALSTMAARSRLPVQRWYATTQEGSLAAIEGNLDEAVAKVKTSAALGERLGLEIVTAFRVAQLCVVCRETEGLVGLIPEIEDAAARLPYVTLRSLVAIAAATTGDADAAAWEVERLSADGFAAVPRDSLWVATIALLAESAAISGSRHTPQLVELLRPHRGTLVVQGIPNCWGSVDRFLGRSYLALGEWETARAHLASALDLESRIGAPVFAARTKLDQARLAVLTDRREHARRIATDVRGIARRIGLTALAEEAAVVLASDARPGPRLSRREREVLILVSTGASNKEIAARLVISLNTVERHLANIYAKLGLRGRAEAAAYAVRAGMVDENGGSP